VTQFSSARNTPVIALDLGDRKSVLARRQGNKIVLEDLRTLPEVLRARFVDEPKSRVVFEAGSQSHWLAWMLEELGHTPIMADPRRLKLITDSRNKSDKNDARWLLLLGESNLELISPIEVRSREQQLDMVLLRNRKLLAKLRASAVLAIRGHAKLFGCALPSGGAEAFPARALEGLAPDLLERCQDTLAAIKGLSQVIARIDSQLGGLMKRHPQTQAMTQVHSIGELTALTFLLTLQSPKRFARNRQVGPAVGLVPRRKASGAQDPELHISKLGDSELRRLLVLAAHRIMAKAAPDSDLKRFGLKLAERGGKNAKKRAAVAVARKLAVLLMALWRTGKVYQPLKNSTQLAEQLPDEAA
jgi:transposase